MTGRPYPGVAADAYERLLRREAVAAAQRAGLRITCPCGRAYLNRDGECPVCVEDQAEAVTHTGRGGPDDRDP